MNALTMRGGGLAPASLTEAMSLAQMLAKSTMVPAPYRNKPEDILVAIAWGMEVGLGALQSLNGISVINGKPALWGDAALALVRGHPSCAGIREGVEGEGDDRHGFCEVTRRGQQTERRTFSVRDAKKAGLWGKQGPWQQYPDRMLQLRARGFAIRDVFPDALRGVITAEEAQDTPAEVRFVPQPPPEPGTHAAAMAQLAPPTDEPLPMISPDGELIAVEAKGDHPAVTRWMSFCRKAVAKVALDGREALSEWARAMHPHLAAIEPIEPEAVDAVRALVAAQFEAMRRASEAEEVEAEA